ncbi:MAG: polysaccharide biosynthesis protein, partial [Erysipelotrichaceae bacterium]|nr:polysaccharide biosynthesis protein [Erysipelotrichaceae bacterium]
MSTDTSSRVKQSFLAGSLTSSAGVFLAKAIGLFYVIPFTALAGEKNMIFYSAPYTYYNVLLQISSAGLPYAIAAIVAKYVTRNDYKTVMLIRRLSTAILSVSGFLM